MNSILCLGRLWVKIHKFYRDLCPPEPILIVNIFKKDNSVEKINIKSDEFEDYIIYIEDDLDFFTIEASSDIKKVIRIFSSVEDLKEEYGGYDDLFEKILQTKRSNVDIMDMHMGSNKIPIIEHMMPYFWTGNKINSNRIIKILREYQPDIVDDVSIYFIDINFDETLLDFDLNF